MSISVDKFLRRIDYKPAFVGKNLDGVVIVTWPEIDKCSPSLEFGTKTNKGKQYFYYEIVDFGHGYNDGEFIPLDDKKRRRDVYNGYINADTFDELCAMVNRSLRAFFRNSEVHTKIFVERDGKRYEVTEGQVAAVIGHALKYGELSEVKEPKKVSKCGKRSCKKCIHYEKNKECDFWSDHTMAEICSEYSEE